MLLRSVKATAGMPNFLAFSTISLTLSNPLEILNSDETLRWINGDDILNNNSLE
jgi:hypothetical protein